VVGTLAGSGAGTERSAGQCNEVEFLILETLPTMQHESGHKAGHNARSGHTKDAYIVPAPIACFKNGQGSKAGGLGYSEETAPTLGSAQSRTQQAPALLQKMAVRRLTVVECARLMGFPDTFCHIPWKRRKIVADEAAYLQSHGLECWQEKNQWYTRVAADGPMYRAYGNAIAVPVIRWIGERIRQVDEIRGGKWIDWILDHRKGH
jgi:site-specific DNA-cytosine methylase